MSGACLRLLAGKMRVTEQPRFIDKTFRKIYFNQRTARVLPWRETFCGSFAFVRRKRLHYGDISGDRW